MGWACGLSKNVVTGWSDRIELFMMDVIQLFLGQRIATTTTKYYQKHSRTQLEAADFND